MSGLTENMDGQIADEQNSAVNISDVMEVIGMDSEFPTMDGTRRDLQGTVGILSPQGAYIKILEQPARKALRFRYECEGRSAGSIPGANSTPENKTYPTIQIAGYKGKAVVVVSCVTKDAPYRPHPHNLVGKEGCKKGVCTVEVSNEDMIASFASLGIQCVKKKDIEEALTIREEIRVDPFRTKFKHKTQPSTIDLNAVRLCFQAFLEGPAKGRFLIPLQPVVSEPIFDKKATADLMICNLSHCSSTVTGGNAIILLCEKVAKEDIRVRFFEEKDGVVVWEGYGDFTPTQVHKQVAITFRTPRYRTLEIDQPVQARIQLVRPSDNATSEAVPFQITPIDSDHEITKRKRVKLSTNHENRIQSPETEQIRLLGAEGLSIKREPETSPNPYLWHYGAREPMSVKMSPIYNSRTPSPSGYGGVTHPNLGVSPIHQPPLMSPIPHPTVAGASFSGGVVYQNDLGAQYQPAIQPLLPVQNAANFNATNGTPNPAEPMMNSRDLADLGVLEGNLLSSCLSISDVRRSDVFESDDLTRLVDSHYTHHYQQN